MLIRTSRSPCSAILRKSTAAVRRRLDGQGSRVRYPVAEPWYVVHPKARPYSLDYRSVLQSCSFIKSHVVAGTGFDRLQVPYGELPGNALTQQPKAFGRLPRLQLWYNCLESACL
jgi:hypothetical protein